MEAILKYFPDLTPKQAAQFRMLEGLYKEWNEKINVISRRDIDHLYTKHVLHSLSIAAVFEFKPAMDVIDIGCGGGFPSIPLAIVFPEVNFLAVDSINKKLMVVKEVAAGAGIVNINTRHTRAGDINDKKFDVAVSRAVAPLKELMQWTRSILKKKHERKWQTVDSAPVASGLICLKGGNLANEIHDSDSRPEIWEISRLFSEEFFQEKFILQVNL